MHWVLSVLGYLVGGLVTVALSLYIYGLRPVYRYRYSHIPGPKPRWLYGNFIESFTLGNHIWQQHCASKYGEIFKVWGLTGPEVTVCSPTLVRQVLLSNMNRTPFPSMVERTAENKDFYDSHILTAKDTKWRSLREAWAPFFYSGSLEQFAERMNYSATLLCQRLDAVADSSTGQTIDMYPLLADLTMDVIARVSFGVELNTQQPLDNMDADGLRAKQLREDAAYSFTSFGGVNSKWFFWVIVFPELTWLFRILATRYPDPPMKRMLEGHKRIMTTVTDLIQQHRKAVQAEGGLAVHDSAMSEQAHAKLPNGGVKQNGLANGHSGEMLHGHDLETPASVFDGPDAEGAAEPGTPSSAALGNRRSSWLAPPVPLDGVQDYDTAHGLTQAAAAQGPTSYPSGLSAKGGQTNTYKSGLGTPKTPASADSQPMTPRTPQTPRTPGATPRVGAKPSDLAKQVVGSRKSRTGIQPGSFLDLLVRGYDRTTGKPFSDGTIIRQGHAMLLAGFETTASTLAFSTYNLARYPEKAAKLYEEIRQQPEVPTLDTLESMPYTEACLKESLRLYPSAAVGNRECQQDCIIGGYKIKKGTYLKCAFWTLQRDPSLWHDPEEYIPERWVEGTPEAARRPQYAWNGFGDGPRACPGGKLAFEEAKIAMIHMFRSFEFRLAPGQIPIKIKHNMTMSPQQGVHVTVHRRT